MARERQARERQAAEVRALQAGGITDPLWNLNFAISAGYDEMLPNLREQAIPAFQQLNRLRGEPPLTDEAARQLVTQFETGARERGGEWVRAFVNPIQREVDQLRAPPVPAAMAAQAAADAGARGVGARPGERQVFQHGTPEQRAAAVQGGVELLNRGLAGEGMAREIQEPQGAAVPPQFAAQARADAGAVDGQAAPAARQNRGLHNLTDNFYNLDHALHDEESNWMIPLMETELIRDLKAYMKD